MAHSPLNLNSLPAFQLLLLGPGVPCETGCASSVEEDKPLVPIIEFDFLLIQQNRGNNVDHGSLPKIRPREPRVVQTQIFCQQLQK